jgi:hypothetical protein
MKKRKEEKKKEHHAGGSEKKYTQEAKENAPTTNELASAPHPLLACNKCSLLASSPSPTM